MRRNKFGAIRTTIDGITFASRHEARRYQSLKLLEKAKIISDLELQPKYAITINGIHICWVILDFRYRDVHSDIIIIEDAKGRDLPISKLKRRLVEAQHGIKVVLV